MLYIASVYMCLPLRYMSNNPRRNTLHLDLGHLAKATDGRLGGDSSSRAWLPGATGDDLAAGLAVPDANVGALQGVLAAEGAGVGSVLRDLVTLQLLTDGSTITGTVLTNDSGLLRALAHLVVPM